MRQEEGKVCVDYLKGRGISGDLAKKFQLGWVGGSWDNLLKSFVGKTISIAPSKNNKSYQLSNVRVTQDMLIQAGLLIKNDKNKVYERFR